MGSIVGCYECAVIQFDKLLLCDFFFFYQGLSPQQIYHVAVMPCFDKKLEASRSDFYMNKAETREVDCVITSGTVTSLTLFFVHIYVKYLLLYNFHCFTQERFRKCWRRKMSLSATWNQHRLTKCKSCRLFSVVAWVLL